MANRNQGLFLFRLKLRQIFGRGCNRVFVIGYRRRKLFSSSLPRYKLVIIKMDLFFSNTHHRILIIVNNIFTNKHTIYTKKYGIKK